MQNFPAIQVSELSKFYGKHKALDSISLSIPSGKITGLLGPNGAGKSTLLRCFVGLIYPSQGKIKIHNKDFNTHRSKCLQTMGAIIEKPDFYLYLSAAKNLEILSKLTGFPASIEDINSILDRVGLLNRKNDLVKTFSHGMKQRLGIAHALIHNPSIIILDEPTTGLDPEGIIELRNLLIELRDKENRTVLLSSHILSEMELIADYFIILNKGKLIQEGSHNHLLDESNLFIEIEVSNVALSAQILSEHGIAVYSEYPKHLVCHSAKNKIPEILQLLAKKEIAVYRLDYKRGLEELFLKITA